MYRPLSKPVHFLWRVFLMGHGITQSDAMTYIIYGKKALYL